MPSAEQSQIIIIYDGECPYCTKYTHFLKLKKAMGNVVLINAREQENEYVVEAQKLNIDLDEGMATKIGGDWYHGADCLNILSQMTTGSDFFNKLNGMVFKSKTLSKILYPIMRAFRNLTLFLLGRKRINQ
ncbi:DCC1-like thiol-disulfide oxidoreductase family protein [Hahella ganghwensis]|uniref:DCC1-like thiol-disulfide oxidoreductase family protein n=1 Tax=Hahella ganghwensis TaxID=286420 RepID=UPI000375AA0D|nr:DCC1-like thiol-disulfide oxidoreductase family protein [Hahella ganghwensis]